MPKLDLGLPTYDSLFSTEEERQDASAEKVTTIPIDKIIDFKAHPFHVAMDEDMAKLIDSIKENDMLMPALVRPKEDGTYEMISGHRRKFALSQLGRKEMNVIVRNLDDDQATILMVDSNIQRENIYPSERGYAYKMRLEAMKHQGKKIEEIPDDELGIEYTKSTSGQVGQKLSTNVSRDLLAQQLGESSKQIQRFIRLTYLVEPLQKMVDGRHENEIKIAFNPAVELSYLTIEEQKEFIDAMEYTQAVPSISQAQRMKKLSREKKLTGTKMREIMGEIKKGAITRVMFNNEQLYRYFPKSYTPAEMKEEILSMLNQWKPQKTAAK